MRLSFLIFLVVIFSSAQSWLGFSVLGVKPNLALAAVIIAVFFASSVWESFFLTLLAALILKFAPMPGVEILIFSAIGVCAALIKKYLPWNYFLSGALMIIVATLFFYLSLSPALIISAIFLKEIIFNLITGILMFVLLDYLWQNRSIH